MDQGEIRIGRHVFRVELATDEATRGVGLGGRASIGDGRGMLFVYPEEQHPADMGFWMKGCVTDLDIAFIDAHRRILTIWTMACQPAGTSEWDMKRYRPSAPAQYALEVQAGLFARTGIKVGDQVEYSPGVEAAVLAAQP